MGGKLQRTGIMNESSRWKTAMCINFSQEQYRSQ